MTWVATAVTAGITIVGAVGKSANKSSLGSKQEKRAAALREEQKRIKANPIDQTYLDNKRIAQNKFISGLPAQGLMQNQLSSTTANALNRARLSTNNSGDLLSAVSALNGQEQNANLDLGIKNAEYKDNALNSISLNNQAIANEKARLESIAELSRAELRKQAGALENAGTANKANAVDEVIDGTTNAGTLISGTAAGMNQDKESAKNWGDALKSKEDVLGVDTKKSTIPVVKKSSAFAPTTDIYSEQDYIHEDDKKKALYELSEPSLTDVVVDYNKGIKLGKKDVPTLGIPIQKKKNKIK